MISIPPGAKSLPEIYGDGVPTKDINIKSEFVGYVIKEGGEVQSVEVSAILERILVCKPFVLIPNKEGVMIRQYDEPFTVRHALLIAEPRDVRIVVNENAAPAARGRKNARQNRMDKKAELANLGEDGDDEVSLDEIEPPVELELELELEDDDDEVEAGTTHLI